MAVSAFYIHKRSVDQVLDRLLNLRSRRRHHQLSDDEEFDFSDYNENVEADRSVFISRNKNKLLNSFDDYNEDDGEARDSRASSSIPNTSVSKSESCADGASVRSGRSNLSDKNHLISSDLPSIRTDQRDGTQPSLSFLALFRYAILPPKLYIRTGGIVASSSLNLHYLEA